MNKNHIFFLLLLLTSSCEPADKEVSACDYPNGCESKGWGDVKGYGNKEVGLCSYLGGCTPSSSGDE